MAMPTQPWHKALAAHIAEHMKGLKGSEVDGWTIEIQDVSFGTPYGDTPMIFVQVKLEDDEEVCVEFEMRDGGPLY